MPKLRFLTLAAALLVVAVAVEGCGLLPFGPVGPPRPEIAAPAGSPSTDAVRQDLADHLALWRARAISDYTWTVSFGCECPYNGPVVVTVAGGRPAGAVFGGKRLALTDIAPFPLTVDALYAQATDALDGGGNVTVTWGDGGIPTKMLLDPILNAVDDELSVGVGAFVASP